MEAAERILTLAYRLQDAFESVRSRLVEGHELEVAETKLKEANPTWAALDTRKQDRLKMAQAMLHRLNRYKDDWNGIFALRPVARAFFSDGVSEQLQGLWRQYVTISTAIEGYADDDGSDRDFSVSLRRDLFGASSKDTDKDEVGNGISSAVANLETALLPVIRADYATAG